VAGLQETYTTLDGLQKATDFMRFSVRPLRGGSTTITSGFDFSTSSAIFPKTFSASPARKFEISETPFNSALTAASFTALSVYSMPRRERSFMPCSVALFAK
jgi:hypothetical protein